MLLILPLDLQIKWLIFYVSIRTDSFTSRRFPVQILSKILVVILKFQSVYTYFLCVCTLDFFGKIYNKVLSFTWKNSNLLLVCYWHFLTFCHIIICLNKILLIFQKNLYTLKPLLQFVDKEVLMAMNVQSCTLIVVLLFLVTDIFYKLRSMF